MFRTATASLFLSLGALGIGAQSAFDETRGTIEQWVQTRQLISRTRAEWTAEKDALEQTRQLFQRELESARQATLKISTNTTQIEKERATAEAQRKELEQALAKAAEIVAGFEVEARKLIPLIPEPLLATVQPLINRLPEDPAKTKASTVERVQAVVALLNEIDKFNNAVTVTNERRDNPAGGQVNVDTVYLGLGIAYFVEPSEKFAGVGTPSSQGWQWTVSPEIAPAVKDVIAMYRNQKPAAFRQLPATIQ